MSKNLILGIALSLLLVSGSFSAHKQRATLTPIAVSVTLPHVPFSAPMARQEMLTGIR